MKTKLLKRLRTEAEDYSYVIRDQISERYKLIGGEYFYCYFDQKEKAIRICKEFRRNYIMQRIVEMRDKKHYKIF